MLEIASQMILCLLLAALLGFIIGYLFGKMSCTNDDSAHTEETQHQNPHLLTEPRDGKKDNLSRIKGIGTKIEESLNDIGIYHFDQIAAWTTENITWADNTLGFPGRADREKWVEQAKLLATGEETEFSKRVDAGEVGSSKQV